MRYRLTLSYRGKAYAGWQRQNNALAVQEVVETALGRLVDESLHVVGAGRTDAGVHALGQTVHLDLERDWEPRALVHGTNRLLPEDVRILAAQRTAPEFHARRDATSKEYHYRLSRADVVPPLSSPFVVKMSDRVSVDVLARAAECIEGRHNFVAFAKSGGAHTHGVRTVLSSEILEDGEEIVYRVVGEGFLRGMVRALVGTLLEVGCGKRPRSRLEALLEGGRRSEAGPNAPARGLVLVRVSYPR